MKREIKFRGKSLDNGKWVYGDFRSEENCIAVPCYIQHFGIGYDVYPVDPDTVGQYTGLKDKNGIDVYEEDVVCLGDIKRRTGVIVRSDTKPAFVLEVNDTAFDLYYRNQHRYEVIGNIHDNPELLKTEK